MVTSVVIRVIKPDVENLSMFAKEYFWIFLYMASRRFLAKPVDATAAKRPAPTPMVRLAAARQIMKNPYKNTFPKLPASIPLSIMDAVTSGRDISKTTSATVQKAAIIEGFLNSFT